MSNWEEDLEQDQILQEKSRTSLEKGQKVLHERSSKTT
jgi:hypothetical protein